MEPRKSLVVEVRVDIDDIANVAYWMTIMNQQNIWRLSSLFRTCVEGAAGVARSKMDRPPFTKKDMAEAYRFLQVHGFITQTRTRKSSNNLLEQNSAQFEGSAFEPPQWAKDIGEQGDKLMQGQGHTPTLADIKEQTDRMRAQEKRDEEERAKRQPIPDMPTSFTKEQTQFLAKHLGKVYAAGRQPTREEILEALKLMREQEQKKPPENEQSA